MRLVAVLLLSTLNLSCGAVIAFVSQFGPGDSCGEYPMDPAYENARYTAYIIGNEVRTPKGIYVDTSEFPVDLAKIDAITDRVEACLSKIAPKYAPIKRCRIHVKIATDWVQCPVGQIFPCADPNHRPGCQTSKCECGCWGIVQWPRYLIVPPDLASLGHEEIHDITGLVHKDGELDSAKLGPVFGCGVQ